MEWYCDTEPVDIEGVMIFGGVSVMILDLRRNV